MPQIRSQELIERERALERDREAFLAAVTDLRLVARERLSPAARIADAPLPWILGGVALGLWLGWRADP